MSHSLSRFYLKPLWTCFVHGMNPDTALTCNTVFIICKKLVLQFIVEPHAIESQLSVFTLRSIVSRAI